MTTILWIEDEVHNISALPKMLTRRGINLVKARTKSEAFERLRSDFDLILLDVILPQDNDYIQNTKEPYDDLVGLSILRKLKTEKYSGHIFVFTIINDHKVREEIQKYKVPYYYKGNTKLKDLCDDIIAATKR